MARTKTIEWMGRKWEIIKEADFGFAARLPGLSLVVMKPFGIGTPWQASVESCEDAEEAAVKVVGHASDKAALAALEKLVRRIAGLK